jgi:hypothetical protein
VFAGQLAFPFRNADFIKVKSRARKIIDSQSAKIFGAGVKIFAPVFVCADGKISASFVLRRIRKSVAFVLAAARFQTREIFFDQNSQLLFAADISVGFDARFVGICPRFGAFGRNENRDSPIRESGGNFVRAGAFFNRVNKFLLRIGPEFDCFLDSPALGKLRDFRLRQPQPNRVVFHSQFHIFDENFMYPTEHISTISKSFPNRRWLILFRKFFRFYDSNHIFDFFKDYTQMAMEVFL